MDPFKRVEEFKGQMEGALKGLRRVMQEKKVMEENIPDELTAVFASAARGIEEKMGRMDLAGALSEMKKAAIKAEQQKHDGV